MINEEYSRGLARHHAWDRTTRMFHWVNFVCVLGLMILGLLILNEKHFGVSADGKILLKTLHVYVGYAFALNLGWRLVWAFIGNPQARWRAILPFGSKFLPELRAHVSGIFGGPIRHYLGHNPLGRMMVSLLLVLMFIQAMTGLVLAGTDLYMPPFGGTIAEWVTGGDAEKLARLEPGSKDNVDPVAYAEMRASRSPVVTTHLYVFYLLLAAVLLHVAGVVIAEFREKSGLTSAMITGDKVLPIASEDAPSGQNSHTAAASSGVPRETP